MTTETTVPKLIDRVEGLLKQVAVEPCTCTYCEELAAQNKKCKACEAIDLLQKFVRVKVR